MKKNLLFVTVFCMLLFVPSMYALGDTFRIITNNGDINISSSLTSGTKISCNDVLVDSGDACNPGGNGTGSNVTNGTGLSLVGDTMSILASYRLPQSCSDGQLASFNVTSGNWDICTTASGTGTVTSITRGWGFNNSGTSITTTGTLNLNKSFLQSEIDTDTNESTRVAALIASNTSMDSRVDTLESNDPSDWDAIGDVPTATPTNGDTTHLSTADQIYDWVTGLGYITVSTSSLTNYYTKTDTDLRIQAVNTTANIEGLGFVTGGHTVDTNESSRVNTLVVNNQTNYALANDANTTAYSKTSPGSCASGEAVQNTTTGGVQCIPVGTGGGNTTQEIVNAANSTGYLINWSFVDTDTNESTNVNYLLDLWTNKTGEDCSAGNYQYGTNADGSPKCRVDVSGGGGSGQWPLSSSNWLYNNSNALDWNTTQGDARYVNEGDDVDTDTVWSINESDIINQSGSLAYNRTTLDAEYVGQSEYPNLDTDSTDDFDGDYDSLSNKPVNNLTHLSNFTDDIGVSNDWDAIGDVPTNTPTSGDTENLSLGGEIWSWMNGNPFNWITSSITTLTNFYNKTDIDTQGEMETIWGVSLATDTELAGQDECSEISGCVVGAITDGNTNWDNSYNLFDKDTDDSTDLSDTADLLYETELDDLAELDTQIGTTGTASSSTYLRGDNSWASLPADDDQPDNDGEVPDDITVNSTSYAQFQDNVKVYFGTGKDFVMYYNSSTDEFIIGQP